MDSNYWRILEDYPNYMISKGGKVFSILSNKTLKGDKGRNNHIRVSLYKNKTYKRFLVHRLVGMYFIKNHKNKPEINHIDSNPINNHVSNLEWVTRSENLLHGYKYGNISRKGDNHNYRKLNSQDVKEIKDLLKKGLSQYKIAKMYGVWQTNISHINTGRSWDHL